MFGGTVLQPSTDTLCTYTILFFWHVVVDIHICIPCTRARWDTTSGELQKQTGGTHCLQQWGMHVSLLLWPLICDWQWQHSFKIIGGVIRRRIRSEAESWKESQGNCTLEHKQTEQPIGHSPSGTIADTIADKRLLYYKICMTACNGVRLVSWLKRLFCLLCMYIYLWTLQPKYKICGLLPIQYVDSCNTAGALFSRVGKDTAAMQSVSAAPSRCSFHFVHPKGDLWTANERDICQVLQTVYIDTRLQSL